MKRPLYLSFALTAALLLIVPLINLMQLPLAHQGVKWWKQKFLYNMDFAHQIISEAIYPLGLSIDPGRVIIGKEDWLYLGDHFEQSISSKRTAATAHDVKTFSKIAESADAWGRWLKLKGVTEFRILIGPDKDSVYPEYLPDWASHSPTRPTHDLMPDRRAGIYIDPTAALRKAKDDALDPCITEPTRTGTRLGRGSHSMSCVNRWRALSHPCSGPRAMKKSSRPLLNAPEGILRIS